jgi:predicted transposase YbfD/YdcC
VEDKSNEITAILNVLDSLDIYDAVVTIDAILSLKKDNTKQF